MERNAKGMGDDRDLQHVMKDVLIERADMVLFVSVKSAESLSWAYLAKPMTMQDRGRHQSKMADVRSIV